MRASRRLHRPWVTSPTTDETFDRLLSRMEDARYEPLFVCLRDTGAIAGWFNIGEIVRGSFQSAFLGYGAVAAHAGHGYMSEGLQLVLARAFRDMGLHRIEANIQPGNDGVNRAGQASGVRLRGHGGALPENRRTLARPRTLGDPVRALARAAARAVVIAGAPPATVMPVHAASPRIRSTSSRAPAGGSGWPVISRR